MALGIASETGLLSIDARTPEPAVLDVVVAAVASGGRSKALRLSWPALDLPPGLQAVLETGSETDLEHAAD